MNNIFSYTDLIIAEFKKSNNDPDNIKNIYL